MSLNNHSAAGSNAGFNYQFERALFWLAESPAGSTIGIETDDDVAIRGANKSQLLEQDKHSIQAKATPFGDRSRDLWNTLAIWIDALDSKEVADDKVCFLMVTNKLLPECIAKQISLAETDSQIDECIAALEKAGQEPSEQIQTQVERVLRPSSRGMLRIVILKCDLLDASKASAGPQLREQTIARLQLPESCRPVADSITNELLGWLHSTALAKWQQNQPVWVERNHFVNQLHAVISLRKRQITRERAEHLIHVTDEKVGKERGNVFVKQLHLITDDDGVVDNAIRDFIRCNIEKSRLSAEGNVTDEDWKSFEAALLTRWDKIRARVTRMSQSKPENDMGFEIFTDTTEAHREKLAGSDTEQVYLTSGTYHRLADMIRVGWHPRFKELMRKLNNES